MTPLYHVQQQPLFVFSQVCNACQTEKSIERFSPDPRYPSGYRTICRDCRNAQRRERQKEYVSLSRPETLTCTKCEKEKPITEFYKNRGQKTGYHSQCKVCTEEAHSQRHHGMPHQFFVKGNNHGTKETKWCYGCRQEKPLSAFAVDATKKDGKTTRCHDCRRPRDLAYHYAHREEQIAKFRARYAKRHHRVKRSKYHPYVKPEHEYARHPLKKRAYNGAYYAHNQYSILAQKQVYYRSHKMQVRQNGSKYRARKRAAAIGAVNFSHILERYGHVCHICNQAIPFGQLAFDHKVPLARGGPHIEENLFPAHKVCNSRKGIKLMEELTEWDRRGPNA